MMVRILGHASSRPWSAYYITAAVHPGSTAGSSSFRAIVSTYLSSDSGCRSHQVVMLCTGITIEGLKALPPLLPAVSDRQQIYSHQLFPRSPRTGFSLWAFIDNQSVKDDCINAMGR